jgi:acetolactate synthase-1/2/3 large subunit/5-guanidino-2-oxopentanoate decarboxylase
MEFQTQRPRPKHIQVPIRVLEADAPDFPPPPEPPQGVLGPGLAQVARIAEALKAANRPLMIFGGGARAPSDLARDVLRRSGAASFVTYAGRGIVDPADPLYFGSTLANPGSVEVIASADFVLAVGTSLAEVDIWRPHLGNTVPMVRVDIDPEVLADGQFTGTRILSDAGRFLRPLTSELSHHKPATGWRPADVARLNARWRAEADAERPCIVPICDALRAVLPGKTWIYSDMTQFAYTAKEVWDMALPGLWHHPFGFGTLGYALPAAIGALARGKAGVVAIVGDYGFQYTVQELATAVELGLPLPILLWDNSKLGEIEASMVRAQIAPNAVTLRNPDFCALARAYGAYAEEPAGLAALTDAVTKALAAPGPTLIRMTPGLR